MSCKAVIFANVTRTELNCLKVGLVKNGVSVPAGDNGTIDGDFQGHHIAADVSYDEGAQSLTVTVTQKPFLATCGLVTGKIHDAVVACQEVPEPAPVPDPAPTPEPPPSPEPQPPPPVPEPPPVVVVPPEPVPTPPAPAPQPKPAPEPGPAPPEPVGPVTPLPSDCPEVQAGERARCAHEVSVALDLLRRDPNASTRAIAIFEETLKEIEQ